MQFAEWFVSRMKSTFSAAQRFSSEHRGVTSLAVLALLFGGTILPLIGQQAATSEPKHEQESAALIRKRAEWFFRQRAVPQGFIPAGARMAAIQHAEQMLRRQGTFASRLAAQLSTIPANTTTWTPIGPRPLVASFFGDTSGRVTALAVDGCDTTGNTVYLGAAEGGIWKSTDGGTNWTPLTDAQASLATGSIAIDDSPATCTANSGRGIVYVGTGEENFAFDSFYGAGVLKSADGGTTWTKDSTFVPAGTTQSQNFGGPFIGAIAVDPAKPNILLAGIQGVNSTLHSGVYESTNSGSTWTRVLPNPTGGAFDFSTGVAFDPADATGNTAYAVLDVPFATGSLEASNGLWKNTSFLTNPATGWSAVTIPGLTQTSIGRMTLALGPAGTPGNPSTTEVLVAVADITTSSSNLLGLFKSTNGGSTWTQLSSTPAFCDPQCFYDMSVAVAPNDANEIFLGGGANAIQGAGFNVSTVIRSTDGGNTWADVTDQGTGTPLHVDTHAFAFSQPTSGPNNGQLFLYTGDDGGSWSSFDVTSLSTTAGLQHWTDLNDTLQTTQFYPGNSIHPSNQEVGFAGSQDNGTEEFSGSLGWSDTEACGDGGWSAIDPSAPSTVYAACEDIGTLGTLNKNLLDGTPGFNGNNWVAIDTPAMDADNADFVPPLVIDPTTPQNLYFGTFRVWQTTNGGGSWTPISADLTGDPTVSFITTMAVAPSSSATVYAGTTSTFNSTTGAPVPSTVWVTTNAQAGSSSTFTEVDTGLPTDRAVTQIAVSPANPLIAFVTFSGFSGFSDTQGHVFETTTGGPPWTDISCHNTGNCSAPLSTDLPNIPVNDIVVDPNDATSKTIYVATDTGVFATSNGGATWSVPASGLPNVESLSLKLGEASRTLRVGTHGRGSWDLQLPLSTQQQAFNLSSILPVSATAAGGSAITMTLNGTGFTSSSSVNFNGAPLSQNPGSLNGAGTQFTVTVPAAATQTGGADPVSVSDPLQPQPTNSLLFSVESPIPSITSISPTSTPSGGGSFTLTVNGGSFQPNSEVLWTINGTTTTIPQDPSSLNTTQTQFTATVPAAEIASAGTASVQVLNPAPGGGQTAALSFQVGTSSTSDFSFSAPSPASQTVSPGGSAQYSFAANAIGSFSSAVTLSCTDPAAQSSCSFAPNPVTPTASGTAVTLTILTAAPAMAPGLPAARNGPGAFWLASALLAAIAGMMMFLAIPRKRRFIFSATFAAAALLVAIAGCGGGGGGGKTGGTPPGTYTVTINGMSGSTTHTAQVTLVVQ